jgi:phenylpyruvate tautomerase PptA (4-oxalocrotonate tautomerase family)
MPGCRDPQSVSPVVVVRHRNDSILMIQFNCILQEKQIPETVRAQLVSGLSRVTVDVLGAAPDHIQVEFREIPHGAGYRGGELSTTSLVRATIPPGCEQSVREKLLETICDMWRGVTGCGDDEVVVSASDSDYVPKVF